MKLEKQKKAAVFLAICIVLSMFTGIPVNAAQTGGGNQSKQMKGLVVKDWIDWEDDRPFVNPEAWPAKETWADLYGIVLYLGYASSEGNAPTPVSAEDISIQYNGEDAGEEQVKYNVNEKNKELIDIQFYKVGDYTISYEDSDGEISTVTIHVDFPEIGFYETEEMTEDGFIREIIYNRGEGKTFYVIPNKPGDWAGFTYKVIAEDTLEGGYVTYVTVNGEVLNPGKEMKDKAEVTITGDAKAGFGLKAVGDVTYSDGGKDIRESYIWCEDTYEAAMITDGEEGDFEGLFITKRAYENNGWLDPISEKAMYFVHADTLQGVIDKLMKAAEKGSVVVGEKTYTIENDGYIWVNYTPEDEERAKAAQYVTTPSDVEGIIMESGFIPYCVPDGEPVQLWQKDGEDLYFCWNHEEEKLYPVTADAEHGYVIKEGAEGKTLEEILNAGYTRQRILGITCQWPELHVDATTDVKILGCFAEAEEGKANVYLGLYEDSDIVCSVINGETEGGDTAFLNITSKNIGNDDIITANGIKVKAVKMAVETDTTVEGGFIGAGDVSIEEEGEKTIRDKIAIEELIAGDEELKQAIIDGEPLKVSLNMNTVEEKGELQDASVKAGIAQIAALMKDIKNEISKIQYLDIALKYQVGEKQGNITETKEDIKVSIALPKDFAKAQNESAKSWKPVVYRYHDGKAERLDSTFKDGKLTFTTGKFSVYAVAIEEIVPIGIKITTPPDRTSYMAGEMFDKKGMAVEMTYSDGSTEVITDYTVPITALKETDKEISVVYGKYTAKQAITVEKAVAPPAQEIPPATDTKVGESVLVGGNTYQVTCVSYNKNTVTYVSGDKKAAKVTVPSTVSVGGKSYQVTAIADNAFAGNSKLTAVTIPASVAGIGKNAFKGCTKLKTVTIPKNVTEIGVNAFYNCSKLTTVKFKGTKVIKIGQGSFRKCSSLKSVTVPKSVKEIGRDAFRDCKKLSRITFKGTAIKKIGKNAFKNIAKKPVIKVPKKKKAAYKRMLKTAGYKQTVK